MGHGIALAPDLNSQPYPGPQHMGCWLRRPFHVLLQSPHDRSARCLSISPAKCASRETTARCTPRVKLWPESHSRAVVKACRAASDKVAADRLDRIQLMLQSHRARLPDWTTGQQLAPSLSEGSVNSPEPLAAKVACTAAIRSTDQQNLKSPETVLKRFFNIFAYRHSA